MRDNWRTAAIVEREDSIVLTLPSGDKQLQRFVRRAGFTLATDRDGNVSIRLDSLTIEPRRVDDPGAPVGSTWTEQIGDPRMDAVLATTGGDPAAQLTAIVRGLLPRLPAGGVRARSTWADSAEGAARVDIFDANERRTARWSSGALSERDGNQVLPVLVREEFEQVGSGSQAGQKMTMTAQGRRIGTYYLAIDGQVIGAQLDDSVAMLISIPATRQVVPTMCYARTTLRFMPISQ